MFRTSRRAPAAARRSSSGVEPPGAVAGGLPQRHEAGRQTEDGRLRRIHLVERLDHDHAVPAAPEGGQHRREPLGGAEHHGRLGFRVGLEPAPARGVRRNGAPQLGQAERVGVLVQLVGVALQIAEHVPQRRRRAAVVPRGRPGGGLLEPLDAGVAPAEQRADRPPDEREGRRLVREALREIDRPVPVREPRHSSNDRFARGHRRQSSKSITRRAFSVCSRFSACSKTTDAGPSITASVTSSPRCAGRQCRKQASGLACAMSRSLT